MLSDEPPAHSVALLSESCFVRKPGALDLGERRFRTRMSETVAEVSDCEASALKSEGGSYSDSVERLTVLTSREDECAAWSSCSKAAISAAADVVAAAAAFHSSSRGAAEVLQWATRMGAEDGPAAPGIRAEREV